MIIERLATHLIGIGERGEWMCEGVREGKNPIDLLVPVELESHWCWGINVCIATRLTPGMFLRDCPNAHLPNPPSPSPAQWPWRRGMRKSWRMASVKRCSVLESSALSHNTTFTGQKEVQNTLLKWLSTVQYLPQIQYLVCVAWSLWVTLSCEMRSDWNSSFEFPILLDVSVVSYTLLDIIWSEIFHTTGHSCIL